MKITKQVIQRLINEELKLLESVDHQGVKQVVSLASSLLKAIETFKSKSPTPAMTNAVTPYLDTLAKTLEQMISNPGSYVTQVKKEPKTVKLRKANDD